MQPVKPSARPSASHSGGRPGTCRTLPGCPAGLGDTNSCLAAIAAKRRKVPIFHMEAGNRCFDFRVPEETNRRIVDHIADINLPYSDIAREYLLREGFPPDQVIKTGSPLREVLEHYRRGIEASAVLSRLGLEQHRYFLVSSHREETVDVPENLGQFLALLNTLADLHWRSGHRVHPSPDQEAAGCHGCRYHPKVVFHKPFGFLDYVKLQTCARGRALRQRHHYGGVFDSQFSGTEPEGRARTTRRL